MTKQTFRCAIYTRKSSDEGLEQSFNSLHAQREAGEAYVKSQSHEGWRVIATRYDDGGFSGGTMNRPGLEKLLADVEAGFVDVVVVYKIDRLTRSLADFARIVELFDRCEVSFVSVTQAFNTTSSMGRLTLNVLLSFAQFEREVTGERIRDKIAASKAKGMWMGGALPLGYDLPEKGTHKLLVNEEEASTVQRIFTRYLELGSVHALQRELAAEGMLSKLRVTASGKRLGGGIISRGALFHLLRNRIYLGQIVHLDKVHDGEHEAIVDADLFERVAAMLDTNARRHGAKQQSRLIRAPLTGKLLDAAGEPMSPTFSRGKSGRSYRYYVSASLQQGRAQDNDAIVRRLPATAIERVVGEAIERWTGKDQALEPVRAARLVEGGLVIELNRKPQDHVALRLIDGERLLRQDRTALSIFLPLAMPMRGGRRLVLPASNRSPHPDAKLVAALRKAHRMLVLDRGMPVIEAAPVSIYERRILQLAFLAPDLQRDILAGRQPAGLNLEWLMHNRIPLSWKEQRKALGWPSQD